MAIIEAVEIAKNRYAPEGSESINLYSYDLASNLTLQQLVQSVCLRASASYEWESVIKMNTMTAGSQLLEDAADVLKHVADGSANWTSTRNFIENKMGISSGLPNNIDTYAKRMQVVKLLQDKMNNLAQSQQEDMIDLQTLVNRRDVAYTTASGVVKTMGQSMSQDAANF